MSDRTVGSPNLKPVNSKPTSKPIPEEIQEYANFTDPAWHQQVELEEPDIWFIRFQAYCNFGYNRTLESFYAEEKRREWREKQRQSANSNVSILKPKNRRIQIPHKWREVARAWHWDKRAIEFDKEQQRLLTLANRTQELEDYRNRRKQFGAACTGVAVTMLSKLKPALDTLDCKRVKASNLTALANFARSAAAIGDSGGASEGQALSVDELIELFLGESNPG